jgi:ferritin-like metal-binding protein YciE
MDGTNDVTVTIYDGITAAGNEVVPTFDADASALGLNGAMQPVGEDMELGLYAEITTAGTARVVCKVEGW